MKALRSVAGLSVLALVVAYGTTARAVDKVPSTLPHADLLQKHFEGILRSDSKLVLLARTSEFHQAVIKEKIGNSELASAVLSLVARGPNPRSILCVGPALAATDSLTDVARVWTAALESKDEKVRQLAPSLLQFLERQSSKPSFDVYRTLLAEKPDAMPLSLIEYMYEHDHDEAFRAVLFATRRSTAAEKKQSDLRERGLLYAQHMIEHAMWFLRNNHQEGREEAIKAAAKQIGILADAPEWWVRYHAARVLKRETQFHTEALLQKLGNDKHEAVRNLVRSFSPVAPTQPEK